MDHGPGGSRKPEQFEEGGPRDVASDDRSADVVPDAELVRAALAGDPGAADMIFLRHATRLHALATRLVRSRDAAEDLLHDTFVYAFRNLSELRKPEALRGWLTKIIVRRSWRHMRRERLKRRLGLGGFGPDVDTLPAFGDRADLQTDLRDAQNVLNKMAPVVRVVWWLQRVEGYSVKEVAVVTDLTVDKVKKRLAAAERRLSAVREKGRRS